MNALQTWLRRKGAGRLWYRWVHRPKQHLDLAQRYGLRLVWGAARGDEAMRRAMGDLPALREANRVFDRPIAFLTGRKFVHQALFCAHSLSHFAAAECRFEFLTDGTLSAEHASALRRLFPRAIIPRQEELDAAVAAALPVAAFPSLHSVRQQFVMLRKLTDSMAGRHGYRLVFDSDMLFWAEPTELITRALANEPLYLADMVADGYTIGRSDLLRLLGRPAASGVNGGLVALNADAIDWELIERACQLLWSSAGDRRLLEQTLWAIALAAQGASQLDPNSYRLLIDPAGWSQAQAEPKTPALLHYAWHARLPYSAGEWRRYLDTIAR